MTYTAENKQYMFAVRKEEQYEKGNHRMQECIYLYEI